MSEILNNLITNLSRLNTFSESEINDILSIAKIKTYKKKEFIYKFNEVSRNICYVNKGLFKTYMLDADGEQHIIYLGKEDYWVTDLTSYATGSEALTTVECIEECEVVSFDFNNIETLFIKIPKFESNFRKMLQSRMVALYKDRFNLISKSAEERYNHFVENNFDFLQRVTQKDIASLLGIFPESLSRIRRQISKKH